jgi:pyruvate,water dikinase
VAGNRDWVAVKLAVEKLPGGAEWLAAFEKARYPWFNVSTGTGWFHTDRSWNDTLDIPLSGIQTYIAKLDAGVNIDRPVDGTGAGRARPHHSRVPRVDHQ